MLQKIKTLLSENSLNNVKINQLLNLSIDSYLQAHLYGNEKYANLLKLNVYEYSAFSQNGEDGIIEEIFKRIGTTNKYFVEFGVEDGKESNTHNLFYSGWQGLWIEANEVAVELIKKNFSKQISSNQLSLLNSFITRENIESLLSNANVPKELDLLSIDIDGNDYYVWQVLKDFKPRLVIIEYNAMFRPAVEYKVEYDANAIWDGGKTFGSSLQTLYNLGLEKGYSLVGCCFTGVNAFFVRNDLVGDKFLSPFTPENHYEPQRFFLYNRQ
jgi:hypothetical protein